MTTPGLNQLPEDGVVELEFTLVYRGPLPAASQTSTRTQEKQQIRRLLSSQLATLWQQHSNLRSYRDSYLVEATLLPNGSIQYPEGVQGHLPYVRLGGFRLLPLISRRVQMSCAIAIEFFRRGLPGDIVGHGGDIDNRLKTLLDALRMPQNINELAGDKPEQPDELFYSVLEDDSLISGLAVDTHQLLIPTTTGERSTDVWLTIHIETKIIRSQVLNMDLQ
jgi:hypothetical protein